MRLKYGLPALAAAVVRSGALAAAGATGVRVLGRDDKVQISDRFHLGSNTKAMTATLAGMMVDEGRLAWTTTIGEALSRRTPDTSKRVATLRKTSWSPQAILALALIQPRSMRLLTGWLNPKASGDPSTAEAGVGLFMAT